MLRTCLCLLLTCLSFLGAQDMRQVWLGSPFLEGWVPENNDGVRGILISNGGNLHSFFDACAYWNFAIIRINTDGYYDKSTGPAVGMPNNKDAMATGLLHGMKELAERTGRPEINWVPIVTQGYSRYSPSAEFYQRTFRSRALAWLNGQNGSGSPDLSPTIPSMGHYMEWENIFSGGSKNKLMPGKWWKRPANHMACASVHWRVYHNPTTYPDLGIIFLDRVIQARIPADWDPKSGPCELKPVKLEDGWIGVMDSWHEPNDNIPKNRKIDNNNIIKPFKEFDGDPTLTSWLLDEETAWAWRSFSTRFEEIRMTKPGFASVAFYDNPSIFSNPVGMRETGAVAGQPFDVQVIVDTFDVTQVEFYANTTHLATVTADQFVGGDIALGCSQNSHANATVTIPDAGIYGIMAKWTQKSGEEGWAHLVPTVVWPAE